ncbi:hypothetical protein M8J76_011212 [Diaphorina citri]|nr:hypothetical protein M8J76_011212 [Diaphorina citri]
MGDSENSTEAGTPRRTTRRTAAAAKAAESSSPKTKPPEPENQEPMETDIEHNDGESLKAKAQENTNENPIENKPSDSVSENQPETEEKEDASSEEQKDGVDDEKGVESNEIISKDIENNEDVLGDKIEENVEEDNEIPAEKRNEESLEEKVDDEKSAENDGNEKTVDDKTDSKNSAEDKDNEGDTVGSSQVTKENGNAGPVIKSSKDTVPELEEEPLNGKPNVGRPTLNLTAKTKIKLNKLQKEDDDDEDIIEVPVIKPKIDVIDVPDEEIGDTEVVSEDELPPPPTKEKVDGAEEVSDEELPAAPKPDLPPEAEDVSDEELAEPLEKKKKLDVKIEPGERFAVGYVPSSLTIEHPLEDLVVKPFSSHSFNKKLKIVRNGPRRPMLKSLIMEHPLEDLKVKPFSSHSFNEQLKIVQNGPPRPMLNISKIRKGRGNYTFQKQWYSDHTWLCGSAVKNKMYCWPCLLFANTKNSWSNLHQGVDDILNFSNMRQRHCKTKDHIFALGQLVKCKNQRIETHLSVASSMEIEKHNALVKENRHVLARLIDCVCFLGKQELAFRGHHEGADSLNRGNYVELLEHMAKTDEILARHLHTSTSPDIQNDLISAVSLAVINEIKEETKSSNFVAIILDKTTDVSHTSQLSTILRYVAQNEVVERFIRFENVSVDRTAQALFNHIERILNEFELQTKLICQTYDGAAVMSGEHDQLQKLLQEKYPTAMFVHCYAHELNLVLQQSVNNITACKVFYSTCSGFAAFFSRAASRSVALTNYANKKFPTIGTRWVYNARLIKVLEEQHVELKALLEDMSNSTILDRETSATAKGFLNFISEQEFRFLLRIFAQIMPRAEILFETLQKTSKDVAFCSRQVDQFLNDVEKVREAVSSIWEEINDHPDDTPARQRTEELTERGKRYRALGYQICDNISQRIRERFNSLPDFFDLLNVEKFKSHKKLFPHQSFYNLLKQYPMFKSIKSDLKLELECLYADPDCGKEKKVQDLYSYLKTSGLAQIWTEVSKLVELFLCIPATSVGVERSCSALKRIQTFQRNKQSQDRKSEMGTVSTSEQAKEKQPVEENRDNGNKDKESEDKESNGKRKRDDDNVSTDVDGSKKPREKSPEKKYKKLPELEKYWKTVKDNPTDFTGWTYLLQYVDQESDVEAAEEAYSAFLSHYPYCYGYWRKYADYEKKKGTQDKCEEVFVQGLKAIPLSVDLWIHFLNYIKSVYAVDPDYVRQQYKASVDTCGLEFRADRLWDSYIKWEISQKELVKAREVFDRVLSIPLQGHTAHFESFQNFVGSYSPKDILPVDEFLTIRMEVLPSLKKSKDSPMLGGDDKPPGDDNIPPGEETESTVLDADEANAIKEKIVAARRKVHKETASAVAERWSFEEGIKRPYFHVKALEKCQLKNWKDYLDFEISKGNEERILVLFERCLIACALYEEFWYKYICYLVDKPTPDVEKIREIYIRACTIHHPKKVNLHFEWAAFEEKYGYPDKAREILEKIEKEHIKLIEIPLRRIALEKRTKQLDTVDKLYEKYLNQWKDEELAKNYFDLAIKYARYSALVLKDVDKAVQILKSAIETEKEKEFRSFQDFTRLHFQLIDTVLHRPQISTSEIVSYLDSMLERSGLTPQQKFYIVTRKLEILEEFGDDITLINKTIQEFRSLSEQAMKAQLESQKMNIPLESVPLPKEKTNVVIVSSDEETDANPSTNTDANPSNNTDANPSTNTDANLSKKLADKKTNISTNSSSPIVVTSEPSIVSKDVVNVTKPTVTTSNTTNQAITIVKREKSPDRDCVQVKADPPASETTSDKEPENKCRFFSTNFKKLLQLVPRIPPGTVLPYKHVQTRETRTQSRNARWRNTAARKKLESHFRDYHFRMFSTPISVKEREGKKPMVRSLVSIRVFPKPFPEQPCPPGELESPSVPSSSDPIESLSIPSSSDPSSTSSNSDATSSSIDAIIDQIWDMKKFLNTNSNPDSSSDEVEILNTDYKSKPRSPEVITISSTPSNSKSKSPNEVTTVNKTKKSKAKKIEEVVVLNTISPDKPVADITYVNTISNVNTTSTLYKAKKKNKKKKKRGKKNTISNVKAPSSVTYLNTVTNTATSLPEILEVHPRPTIPPVTPVTQTSASTPVTQSFTSMPVNVPSHTVPNTKATSFTKLTISKSQSTSEPSTSLPQALPAPRPVIFPNYPRTVNKPVTTIVSGIRPNPVPRFSNTPRSLANTIGNQMNPTPSQSHANLTSTTASSDGGKQTNTLLASLDEDMKELKKREEVLKKILANLERGSHSDNIEHEET